MSDQEQPPADAGKAEKADLLLQAEDAVLEAIEAYRRVLAAGPVLDSTEIAYRRSKAVMDNHKFDISPVNTLIPFSRDNVFVQALYADVPALQAILLSFSPHWEDRIRAAALQQTLDHKTTMPDGFPCIFKPADPPRNADSANAQGHVWVASPDEGMLHELLPLYRELWQAYDSQWPNRTTGTFEVGRLDNVPPYGVYRPGTTPGQVIGQTMLTHPDLYRTAPEHLRVMHPRHADWSASRHLVTITANQDGQDPQ